MKKPETKAFEVDDIFDMTPIEPSNQANQNNNLQNTGIDSYDLFGGPQQNNQPMNQNQNTGGMNDIFGGDLLGNNFNQQQQNQFTQQQQQQPSLAAQQPAQPNNQPQGLFDMDLFGGGGQVNQQPAQQVPANNMMTMDLFGNSQNQPQQTPNLQNFNLGMDMGMGLNTNNQNTNPPNNQEQYDLEFSAFKTDHLDIMFHCNKQGTTTKIKACYNNLKPTLIGDLNVKLAAAKHLRMNLMPLNKDSVDSNSKNITHQMIEIENTMQGKKGIALKLKLNYKITGMNVEKEGVINGFPSDY